MSPAAWLSSSRNTAVQGAAALAVAVAAGCMVVAALQAAVLRVAALRAGAGVTAQRRVPRAVRLAEGPAAEALR